MKFIYLAFFSILLFFSCEQKPSQEMSYFGDTFEVENTIASTDLKSKLGQEETVNVQLEGEITGVCQKKGCWMTMPMGEGEKDVFVKFKDYKFFVPKDAAGKKAVIKGIAKKEVIDVATLKHYAEDAGKTEEEIAKIDAPEVKYTFMAEGVAIEN
ncbi:DUF4920 domain-containing protein [Flammeovirga sp. SJP92]|uniref:DUF4920 domain-containing protein n=1 Tax=Flammeovirga sp. SJP92 TaxID=1775430 RepID=UPI0007914D6B|nr:DUF4920 domain-containing protein [Flammeovirga sp. SJP92]KXX68351.1 hypothetical protein AVL50_21515 [Flammeovirga sp. SJP92]